VQVEEEREMPAVSAAEVQGYTTGRQSEAAAAAAADPGLQALADGAEPPPSKQSGGELPFTLNPKP
jgi:hypothetical protein